MFAVACSRLTAVRGSGLLALASFGLLLTGCASGDFDRAPAYAPLRAQPGTLQLIFASNAPLLTDDEKQFRKLADTILAPPFSVAAWTNIVPVAPVVAPVPDSGYAAYLLTGPFRSATARYSRLIDDIRNDLTQLDQFLPVARRVADLDQKREQSLAYVTGLNPIEFDAAQTRIGENVVVLTQVVESLRSRAANYRFTLERLVILLPSPMAAEAERMWKQLDQRVTAIQVIGPRRVEVAALPGGRVSK
ncbi:MAG: hypothetical protein QOD74_1876 [Variibacter sp.]|nr:hypothetical protein [Variibacter sp.]